MSRALAVLAALSLAVLAPRADAAASPASPASPESRADAVFREYDRSDSPGCALGVFRDGRIVYSRGYGMANLELGVANSPHTVFDIGSTAKQFAAFSIHLLAREGKLTLDDDVRKHIPELPAYAHPVTIRHLLHHTSGLRDYLELMDLAGIKSEDWTTDQDALDLIVRQKAPNFEPGEKFLYSNTGFFLLSVIVKRASGKSLRDFARERIFDPLGMRHTQYNDEHGRIIPDRATGYAPAERGGFGIDMSDFEQTGDGGILTSVEDLFRWDQNFFEPRVGDRALLDEMQTTASTNDGKKLEYASGLFVGRYRGLRTVSHGGSWAGYRAELLRFPDQKLSVACLCNVGPSSPSRLAKQVAEVYLGDRMEAKKEETPAVKPPHGRGATVSPEALAKLAGAYRDKETGTAFFVSVRENTLVVDAGGQSFPLTASGPLRFLSAPREGFELRFEKGSGKKRPAAKLVNGEETIVLEPIEPWSRAASDLGAFAGDYVSEEVPGVLRVELEAGKLRFKHRTLTSDPWRATTRDAFAAGGSSVQFERTPDGAVSAFTIDTGRVRNIRFGKVSKTAGGRS